MKKMMLITVVLMAVLGGCSQKQKDLKSPCVGAEGSPCERRAPANQA